MTSSAVVPKPKNIVLFLDGTWNRPSADEETNVHLLYRAAELYAIENADEQCVLHLCGVGTEDGLSRARFNSHLDKPTLQNVFLRCLPNWLRNWLGGVSGWGTAFNIQDAYTFLCKNYKAEDRIYFFGFSRGAYAVRSLAGFVQQVGILPPTGLRRVKDAYELYKSDAKAAPSELKNLLKSLRGGSQKQELPIHFIGTWDTVGALGIPGQSRDIFGIRIKYHDVELPDNVSYARQALALHELRRPFEPVLWRVFPRLRPVQQGLPPEAARVQQVWFAGAHADVGGGYSPKERALSQLALIWMVEQAKECKLKLDESNLYERPLQDQYKHELAPVHHEIRKWFVLCKPSVRQDLLTFQNMDTELLRSILVHPSAIARLVGETPLSYSHFCRTNIRGRLEEIDETTLRLHLFRRSEGMSGLSTDGQPLPEDWWKTATVSEVREVIKTALAYVDIEVPTSGESDACFRALAIIALLDDQESWAKITGKFLAISMLQSIARGPSRTLEAAQSRLTSWIDIPGISKWNLGAADMAARTKGWIKKLHPLMDNFGERWAVNCPSMERHLESVRDLTAPITQQCDYKSVISNLVSIRSGCLMKETDDNDPNLNPLPEF